MIHVDHAPMIDLSRLFKSSTERLRAFDIETQMFHATVAGPHISIAVRDTCVHVVTYSKAAVCYGVSRSIYVLTSPS